MFGGYQSRASGRAELRALRLLTRDLDSRSDTIYLGHIERLARARGPGAEIARTVKRADLTDRILHSPNGTGGWSPPYELGLETLQQSVCPVPTAGSGQSWEGQ